MHVVKIHIVTRTWTCTHGVFTDSYNRSRQLQKSQVVISVKYYTTTSYYREQSLLKVANHANDFQSNVCSLKPRHQRT